MPQRRMTGLFLAAALVQIACSGFVSAVDYRAIRPNIHADSMMASMSLQRTFAATLPSVADYSQTAHMQTHADEACNITESKWVMWDTPFTVNAVQKSRDDDQLGYTLRGNGFATGIGRLFGPNTTVGLAVGYDFRKMLGRDDVDVQDRADTFHSALYAGTSIGCLFLDGYAGFSRSWHRSIRHADLSDPIGYAHEVGNYNGTILSTGLKASYVWALPGAVRIIPSIGIDFSRVTLDGFHERSKGNIITAFRVNDARYNNVQVPLRVAVNRTFRSSFLRLGGACSMWTPEIRAGWVPQFGSDQASVKYASQWIPGTDFSTKSSRRASSYGTVGAGMKIQIRDKFIFAVDYDYTFASKYSEHVLTGTYGVSF